MMTRLESAGYEVRAAPDAMLGIKMAHQLPLDLILLDLKLPAGGGLAVLENLQKSINTKLIPIIVVTGYPQSLENARGWLDEPLVLLTKPLDYPDLLRRLACALAPTRLP